MTSEELAAFDGPDNANIADTEIMWRRIFPGWIVPDEKASSGSRLSSQAFEESRDPPSPCSLIRAVESTPGHVQKSADYSVGAIQAGTVRAHDFKLVYDPDPKEPGHHQMVGPNQRNNKQHRRVRNALAGATAHVVGPRWGTGIAPPAR